MRILVTGGAGFIGSHLCDRLLAEGHEVIAMDNLLTGSTDNIAHLAGQERFRFIHHDVTNYIFIEGPLDAVLHLASPASPIDYLELPIQTLKVGALGTHKALGLAKAKGARFLLTSTSEVYGDPLVHPQPETYWGNVNPVGPRGVYDEAKRFAEAMVMAYQRFHQVNTKIVRIFNSIMADEMVVLFNDEHSHIEPIEEYANSIEKSKLEIPRRIYVPSFNPETFKIELRLANALIKHPSFNKDAFKIKTRYGRHIKVTGDHSVFRQSKDGTPEAIPVRQLKVGDYVAIPSYLPVIEKDRTEVNIAEELMRTAASKEDLWNYAISSSQLIPLIEEHKELIFELLMASSHFDGSKRKRNTVGCTWRYYRQMGLLPLILVSELWRRGLWSWPVDAMIRPYTGGRTRAINNNIAISNDLLWLLGLYIAEGCFVNKDGDYRLLISTDGVYLERAAAILESHFGVTPTLLPASETRSPSLYSDSKLLLYVFQKLFEVTGASKTIRIPPWIMQLPLSRVKHFLEGYREGDGTHTGYEQKRELTFVTTSEGLATDLTYLLMRFGLVASVGEYTSTIKRYPDKVYPFNTVTICEVDNFDILTWDQGVRQTLNAGRIGDLVWAPIKEIEPIEATNFVYDFSVEGYENFVAGNGVCAHNTYGPRMRLADGRVVPNFIQQALRREPLTVYGDGQQTRSFQYVSDLVEGIYRLLRSEEPEPVNIGNPHEFTIREFAELVNTITENPAGIVVKPDLRIADDPQTRKPDITKAQQVLGWEPRVNLEEGLRLTIPWFREQLRKLGQLPE
jgi:UDP-glucuronate decarboxylase